MARLELTNIPYAGRSVIASGQECVNLYAEINAKIDPQAPAQVTYYPTPGCFAYAVPSIVRAARGCYRTSIGTAYYVVGPNVYFLTANNNLVFVGAMVDRPNQVYFSDNGLVCVLVDGTSGYVIDLLSNNFGTITDPNFYGADYVALLDTFFIFNRPGTNQFYITGSNVNFAMLTTTGAFNALDIAAKSGFSDAIVGIVAIHRELWLIGALTTEIWVGTGAADFYFQQQQGSYINHGCAAQYSIATLDVLCFFVMQDNQGNGIVVQGQGYDVTEISTSRLVSEFKSYATLTDAVGFCFQMADHAFYCLVFPTASKGWLYDLTTKQWSEWNYADADGNLFRPRGICAMFVYGVNLVGDWETGKLLQLDLNTYQDIGQPIIRIRTFAHMNSNNDKSTHLSFDADMEVGTTLDDSDPQVSLSWSDNKGYSYGNPVMQSMGKIGNFLETISWNRLGQARDRLYKLQWSTSNKTALNGGFLEHKKART